MNVTCLLLLVILGIGVCNVGGAPGEVSQQAPNKFEQFLYDRCRQHSSDASRYDKTQDNLAKFTELFKYAIGLLPNGREQFCNDERPRLRDLMSALTSDVKYCFPKDERYLTTFINDSFVEFLNFLCSYNGRHIDSFFSTQGRDCRDALKRGNASEEVPQCFKKLFNTFTSTVKKEDLCYDLKSAQSCFGEQLQKHCYGFKGFETLNNNFFKAIQKPCSAKPNSGVIIIGSQGLLLAILAVLCTKFF